MHPQPAPSRAWARVRASAATVPALVWVLVALHGALLASFTVLYPPYLSFDEPQHVDMVVALEHGDGWPGPGERTLSKGVGASSDQIYGGKLAPPPLLHHPQPRSQRPSLDQLGGDAPSTGHLPNQIVQHPPLYYSIGALVMKLWPGQLAWDQYVGLLRLISALLVLPLPLLAWAATTRITSARAPALAAAAVPLLLPGLTRIGAAVNNDDLLILLGGGLSVVLAAVAMGDVRKRVAVYVGLLLGLALLTKGFALVLPLPVVAAYASAWWRRGGRPPIVPLVIAGALSFALGGWWYVRNLVLYHGIDPDGYGAVVSARLRGHPLPPDHLGTLMNFYRSIRLRFVRRFVTDIGLFAPPAIPHWLGKVIVAVVAVAAVLALLLGVRRRRSRLAIVTLLLPLVSLFAIVMWIAWGDFHHYGRLPGIQGRYVYPGVAGAAAVMAIGISRATGPVRRVLPLAALGAGLFVHLEALHSILKTYWQPVAPPQPPGAYTSGSSLHVILAWSPWPEGVTGALFVTAALLAVAAVALAVREAWRPETATDPDPSLPADLGRRPDAAYGEHRETGDEYVSERRQQA